MKKILGIVGSPRCNGNTHLLVSRVMEGARESGAETETILLGDLHIRECDGCHACWRNHPCSKDDDMNALYSKIMESDHIVFGTPVYWYGPTALMKALVDRFVYFCCPGNRGGIAGKTASLAIPLEETDPETWTPVTEFFRKSLDYLGIPIIGTIIAPGVGEKGAVRNHPEFLREAHELGMRLGRD